MEKIFNYLYVVTMYRFGSKESHSYVIGVFDSADKAQKCAEKHKEFRDNKYEYEIAEFCVNRDVQLNTYSTCYEESFIYFLPFIKILKMYVKLVIDELLYKFKLKMTKHIDENKNNLDIEIKL